MSPPVMERTPSPRIRIVGRLHAVSGRIDRDSRVPDHKGILATDAIVRASHVDRPRFDCQIILAHDAIGEVRGDVQRAGAGDDQIVRGIDGSINLFIRSR